MNILFICDEYPPGKNGGIGTMVQVLGRELFRQGHSVTVIGLYPYYYGEKDFEIDQGVEVHRLRYGINFGRKNRNFFYKVMGKMPDFIKKRLNGKKAFEKFIVKIKSLIEEKKIDIIEIQDWSSFVFNIGFHIEWPQFKVPLVVKSNGSYTYFCDEMKVIGKEKFLNVDKALYKRADALSSVSCYTESVNKRLFNYTQGVKILYNSIETPSIKIDESKKAKTFIFTGTLIKKKGIFQLAQAWNIVTKKHSDAILEIYGKGEINAIKELLNETSQNTVQFKGHVGREMLFQELSRATAAIFPSYSECFALAPLEALAVGCPVINTSKASGKELIIDGENGSLIDPDNIEEIAEKIIELMEHKGLQKKYAQKGRETILEKFTIAKSAEDHISFYKEVVQNFNKEKNN
ncbi:MAG TPA: glycosyltransferase family 4 protein [Crocinitomicaceae bacterium]|nr:glycosyltransferase family 4 protein [Crocinitomicaceae bacterium]